MGMLDRLRYIVRMRSIKNQRNACFFLEKYHHAIYGVINITNNTTTLIVIGS